MTEGGLPHRRFVASLFGMLKLMQMYGPRHDATKEAVVNLAETATAVAAGNDETVISVRGARLQVNGLTMRAKECGNLAISFLVGELSRRRIAAIHIRQDATPDEIGTFSEHFLALELGEDDPADTLASRLFALDVQGITIERAEVKEVDPILQEERRDATMRTYLQGLRAFKEVLRDDGYPDRTKVRRARRAVQGLVDRFLEDEAAVLTLAQISGFDVKLFHHCMNVSLHALAIGQRIGLSRRQLGELGLAALFHDLGKTVPTGRRPGESEEEARRREVHEHPSRGARMLLAESGGHGGMLKAAITAFEQHAHFDRSGHPAVDHQLHLYSRIVTIADCFDALTSQRTADDRGHSAYEAFRLMQARAGTIFDPILLKVFMNALGIYPTGSVVVLDTGEVALVIAGPEDPKNFDKPMVRILDTADGDLEKDTDLDLATDSRTITETRAAHEVFASIGDLVAAV